MLLLILGVALWWAAHLWRRLAPASRARLGQRGKGIVAALLALSVLLMVIGYQRADSGPAWWVATPATRGINNLMVLVGIYLFAASGMKTRLGVRMRHPQLIGFSLWAAAHVLVNGDLPSLVLFGGLLLWALVEIALINQTPWVAPPAAANPRKEVMAVVGAVVVFAVLALIHGWVGPSPFTGA